MPGKIVSTDVAVMVNLLKTEHWATRNMIYRIMHRVRGTHAVNVHNAAHSYNIVKSPGFDK